VNVNATSPGRRLARPCNIDRIEDWGFSVVGVNARP
jgi:hypothetical protein